jgi:ribosomal protein L12E/L44/L45/RPP1/RPP2
MDGSNLFELSGFDLDSLDNILAESPRLGTPFIVHLEHSLGVTDEDLDRMLASIASDDAAASSASTSCQASAAVSSSTMMRGQQPEFVAPPRAPFVASNNKLDLDSRWKHLEHLDIKELNLYIKTHRLCAADVAAIKQARRRAKNRKYSEDARKSRKDKATVTLSVYDELEALRAELAQTQGTVARLSALVAQHGIELPRDL